MQPIEILESIRQNIRKVIVGRTDTIDLLLTSLVAGGHVLLEDVPGTGKTLLSKSLAKSMSLVFSRIQFTLLSSAPYTYFPFFFNDTATTEIYTLSLHDALPI